MIMNGFEVASDLSVKLKKDITEYCREKRKPVLAIIKIGEDEASNSYIKGKIRASQYVGIIPLVTSLSELVKESSVTTIINELNVDENIDGIILQLPIPDHLDEKKLLKLIDPNKDVDGLHPLNLGLLFQKQANVIPATPKGVMTLLDHYEVKLSGKKVVIIGRSNLVGVPLFKLLLDRDATVTVCHSKTVKIKRITKKADILIVATGSPGLVTQSMVKRGVIVIDIGISRIEGKLVGDVDFPAVARKAKLITPVPKGVGPMTIYSLLENTFYLYKKTN